MTGPLVMDGPVLLFGGPYSNLQATVALLAEAGRLGIPNHRIVCTGDVVAYGADPVATLDLVIGAGIAVVMGNCEESLAAGAEDCGCGFADGTACAVLSRDWFGHANARVTTAHRRWMAALPRRLALRIGGRTLAVVHGGAEVINRFLFPSATDQALLDEIALLNAAGADRCDGVVAGHSGIPFTRLLGTGRDRAVWHNPGAIGMPADDGTPRAWYSIVTPDRIDHRALAYDWPAASAAMRQAGLAAGYADALGSGIWPSDDVLPPAERDRRGTALQALSLAW